MKAPTISEHLLLFAKIALAAVCGIALNYVSHSYFSSADLQADGDILGSYLQVVGGIYAVVIGFVIFVVWGQFTESESVLEREVAALSNILRLESCLEDSLEGTKQHGLLAPYVENYAKALMREARHSVQPDKSTNKSHLAYLEMVNTIRTLPANTPKAAALFTEILRQLENFTVIRNYRIILLSRRIPWILWDMLVFASIIMVVPFFFLNVQNPLIDHLIVGSTTAAVTFLLSVVHDLDDPFEGVFNVDFGVFKRLLSDQPQDKREHVVATALNENEVQLIAASGMTL